MRPYLKIELGVVAHVCGPSYLGRRRRSIMVQGQPEEKHETLAGK
jgi:hypothetical protein